MGNLQQRIGARIRELRLARRLSQEELSEHSGVSYKFIGDVERGHANPTINWLDAVARGLGVTVKDLIVDEPPRAVSYPALTGRDYSIVREARDSLEAVLRRYGDKPTKSAVRRGRHPRSKRM